MKRFAYLGLCVLTFVLALGVTVSATFHHRVEPEAHVDAWRAKPKPVEIKVEQSSARAALFRTFVVNTGAASPFTGTAPSATACDPLEVARGVQSAFTKGLPLQDCKSYYVCLAAANGQTLSGAGNLDMYFWDPGDVIGGSIWTRASNSDEAVPAAASGKNTYCFPARVLAPGVIGCLMPVPNAVTASGGTTVTTVARCLQ